jgi:hypothetical protein
MIESLPPAVFLARTPFGGRTATRPTATERVFVNADDEEGPDAQSVGPLMADKGSAGWPRGAIMRSAAPGLALLMSAGCYSYRAAPTPVPEGAVVRLRFDRAQSVPVAVAGRGTVRLPNVRKLEGRVISVRGDTLQLELAALKSGLGYRRGTVVVVPQVGRPAEVPRFSVLKTAGALLVAAAVVTAGIFAGIATAQAGG